MQQQSNLDRQPAVAGANLSGLSVDKATSPVLARLIAEVRNEGKSSTRGYDRVHNRHNRG
jgi:hypothetical protein